MLALPGQAALRWTRDHSCRRCEIRHDFFDRNQRATTTGFCHDPLVGGADRRAQ